MTKEFRVIIAGSRGFDAEKDFQFMCGWLDHLLRNKVADGYQIIIICGKARGGDDAGDRYAKLRGYTVEYYEPQWEIVTPDGKRITNRRAGMERNENMGRVANAAAVIWDGTSRGSQHMMQFMQRLKKPVRVWRYLEGTLHSL
ncbi:GTP binding protein [Shewanella phage SppYZU05]|uniref:GTP binding protein n=1 Tax=Shewanella phage SppYZU05 TaxID=1970795 RepID=A0A1W6JTJ6_9CAUD|nr:GTP binding protein [Shewanella phage SppYZU05]ARM70576.1 GTP binding protein [Shewanella phage SppYZU05]